MQSSLTANADTQTTSPSTANGRTDTADTAPAWHTRFLAMLPRITTHARVWLRHLRGDTFDEALQEVIANALMRYAGLAEQGREEAATWSSLARYAVTQVRCGRKVGSSLNVKDVSSEWCQRRKAVDVHSLHVYDRQDDEWRDLIEVEDDRTPVPEQAAFRIDFPRWLRTLSRRDRKVAFRLARGERTQKVARQFGICSGRVSQLRRELYQSWREFHGDVPQEELNTATVCAS